ncbi:FAD/NAD(P)-binding oxidoreductase family protein [Actinidia rufa]|uniref:FAD/NAD(P)-binding oxidoreductase family protein n=1 Tax=Actinidia rufa TaxID=165716 RepID=A0A7J0EQ81_9ERIC|nr:FAD/NAD(P)-binding oxidoreductase family protein [Actinidia rufa]
MGQSRLKYGVSSSWKVGQLLMLLSVEYGNLVDRSISGVTWKILLFKMVGAVGVKIRSGQFIRAKKAVVSNALMWNTLDLLPKEVIPKSYQDRIKMTPQCESFMHLTHSFTAVVILCSRVIGVLAVAASGALVANSLVSVSQHSQLLDAVGM